MHVYTTLDYFAWSTWCLNIMGVLWLSIKPGFGYMKTTDAEIWMLKGFIPLTTIQVVKCFIVNLFFAFGGTLVQSSPNIAVESLKITFWDTFYFRNGNNKDQNRGSKQILCKFVFSRYNLIL